MPRTATPQGRTEQPSEPSATTAQIARALSRLFVRHRIVVWSDPLAEFGDDFRDLDVPGVQSVVLANDEFAVKHRILRESRSGKFLVYRAGPVPEDRGNWLLDVELAHGRFRPNRETLFAQDSDLPDHLLALAVDHGKFFAAAKRRQGLVRRHLGETDTLESARWKMLSVIAGSEDAGVEPVLRALLQDCADHNDETYVLVVECALDGLLWQAAATQFGYSPAEPSLEDFSLWVFDRSLSGFALPEAVDPEGRKASSIAVFFRGWQDSVRHSPGFRALSARAENVLGVRDRIAVMDFRDLLGDDAFRAIDVKILTDLATAVAARTVSDRDVTGWVRDRRRTFWVSDPSDEQHVLDHLYAAVDAAARFLSEVSAFTPVVDSIADGLAKYTRTWFRIDQTYREFTFHARAADNHSVLQPLRQMVEKHYSNAFLRPLGDAWQQQVDMARPWRAVGVRSQREFFDTHVASVIKGGRRKIVVIISDGMRYEVAEELRSRIRKEDRFDATIDHLLGSLPSYTQLGMASLLPNKSLEPDGGSKAYVLADGAPTTGTENRAKVLQAVGGTAIQAEPLLAMTKEEARDLLKSVQVLYVYHDRIDKTGDTKGTERRVFQAAEETLVELLALIKKLANANANNILITADHGFIYQDTQLDESEYVSEPADGDTLLFRNSRFVFGRNLGGGNSFAKYTAAELGLAGDLEVLIPKSIGRLRLPGPGTRYVHGGASLQEVVVPVVSVNKKRTSDVRTVEVQLAVRGSTITTGQIVVEMFQTEPVTDKVQPRALRIGLYVGDELISERADAEFDLQATDPRDRTVTVKLLLSKAADAHDGQQVELRLETQVPKTNHYTTYARATYTLRRSFTTDFDL